MPKFVALTDSLYGYIQSVSLREPELLRRLRQETAADSMARMQIAPDQGQFMALLVKLMRAERALEVGVYTGYSSLCVAMALPPNGKLVALDRSEEWTAIARRYWAEAGVAEKVELRLGEALDSLDSLIAGGETGSYDFAFIDADKEGYDGYFERCLELLRPRGLIAIDNVLWDGKVAEPGIDDPETAAIRALNSKLYRDERIDLSLVPIADGLTLACKRG